ncbi:hypothetical protein VTH82DRAFT_4042 [Thermothelomyces myriococcoides]
MESKPEKGAWVASLTETMPLTALDYTAPQNYMMKCFLFPFSGTLDHEREAAVDYLRDRLARVLSDLPFLAGQIIHTGKDELPRLVYPGNGTPFNFELFPDEVFDHQVLDRSKFPWAFDELSAAGVPARSMIKDLFWLLPKTAPRPGDSCHPVTLRASFIDGGLILGFSLHHGIMDGGATAEFFKLFAAADDLLETSGGIASLKQRKNNFIAFATGAAQTSPVNPLTMPGYDFASPSSPTPSPPGLSPSPSPNSGVSGGAVAKILTVSAATATALHDAVLAHLRTTTQDLTAFASTTDTLCALVWVHVTRARLRRCNGTSSGLGVRPEDITHFATAVDLRARGRLAPSVLAASTPSPPHLAMNGGGSETEESEEGTKGSSGGGYLGNLFLRTQAGTTVGELVGLKDRDGNGDDDDGHHDDSSSLQRRATTAQIAEAAWRIRRAVAQIDEDPATVEAHIAIAARATHAKMVAAADADADDGAGAETGWHMAWPDVDAAIRRAIARHHAGLDASVGVNLGADVEFAIPGVSGGMKVKAAWVRRAYVPNEGAMSLLPRRGGTKGGENWEIWLALREEDMKILEEPSELGGWLSRPPA